MPVFCCRWPNGDLSFVSAANKNEAVAKLDEVGSADAAELVPAPRNFMVHFKLREQVGEDDMFLELAGFGEQDDEFLDAQYPILSAARYKLWGFDDDAAAQISAADGEKMLQEALSAERERLQAKEPELSADGNPAAEAGEKS